MSDIESLFLAAYPLWPKVLLNKFSSLLSLEIAKFNPEVNTDIVKKYNDLQKSAKAKIEPYIDNTSYLLSPSNPSKISQVYYGKQVLQIQWARPYHQEPIIFGPSLTDGKWYAGKVYFDTRIFKSIVLSLSVDYQDNGRPFSYSFLSLMSYDSIFVQPVLATVYVVADVTLNNYTGASSVLAMIENGIKVDADENLLREFVTFLNAYSKYSAQLAAGSSLQSEKNKQDLQQYKNAISDKLTARKNELNDLRTQISFAARNETASAKRDMQNLALNAQSLMLQLQEKLQ